MISTAQMRLARTMERPRHVRQWPGRFCIVVTATPPTENIYGNDFEKMIQTLDTLDVAQKTIECGAFFEFLYETGWYGRFVEPIHDIAKMMEGRPMSVDTARSFCVLQSLPYHDAVVAIENFANGLMGGTVSW